MEIILQKINICSSDAKFGPSSHQTLVEDELVKVVRIGNISVEVEGLSEDDSSSLVGLDEEFTSQILSGVRFAPLVMSPIVNTVIPSNVWNPSIQRGYPAEFKHAGMQLLMCSNSRLIQPLPQVPSQEERFNAAAMLPKSIWVEILSYTHRKCKFSLPQPVHL